MVKCGPVGMLACSLGSEGLGLETRLGSVLGSAMVLGQAHFTFCH